MEWFALGIPVVTAIVLLLFFSEQTVWWELFLPFVIAVIVIAGGKFLVSKSLTRDVEFWGSYTVKAEYFEDWNEEVTYTVVVTHGSGKDSYTTVETRTRIDYHPAEWDLIDSIGQTLPIAQDKFESLVQKWGNSTFVDMNRSYYSNDGDKYETEFPNVELLLDPIVTKHIYENRVQASDSVFKFKKVDPKDYDLYEYPPLEDQYCPSIFGGGGKNNSIANRKLDIANATLGPQKKVRIWLLLFQGKPLQAALDQENHWKGSNKNELVVCIGHHKEQIDWCYVFSWTEIDALKVGIRQHVTDMKELDLAALVDWMVPEIRSKWEKKNWHDFDYLTIALPGWGLVVIYTVTIVLCGLVSLFVIGNDYADDNGGRCRYGTSRYDLWSKGRRFNRARWNR